MRKKLIQFSMYLLLFAIIFSCRPDLQLEENARNQAEAPMITSKIIALSNSAHKQKLLLELNDAKKKLTNSEYKFTNKLGKQVAFGDSIVVDTDNVIMIENGSNYHTYTFKIDRTTTSLNAPLENLLFSPLPDGSYQGYWIVYDLTEAEKLKISNGEFVNVKNKTKITKLENISLSSLSKSSGACTSSYYYPTLCIEKKHLPDKPCAYIGTSGEAQWIQVIIDNCEPEYNVIAPSPVDGSNGGGGPNDGTETPPDDPCVTSAANPGEVGLETPEGCAIGVPTEPNVGNPNVDDPCEKVVAGMLKAKEIVSAVNIKNKIEILQPTIATDVVEKGFSFGTNSAGTYVTSDIVSGTATGLDLPVTNPGFTTIGSCHTHNTLDAYECFSPTDFYQLYAANKNDSNFSTMFALGATGSIYNLTISDQTKFDQFSTNYPVATFINPITAHWKEGSTIRLEFDVVKDWFANNGKTDDESFALANAYVLKKYNIGITISKKDASGNFKPIFVNEIPNPTDATKKTYEQTDKCNL